MRGSVESQYEWVNMQNMTLNVKMDAHVDEWLHVRQKFGYKHQQQRDGYATVNTCPPAFGYSMAAGTAEGQGTPLATEGMGSKKPSRGLFVAFQTLLGIGGVSRQQKSCQWPKPVLMNAGEKKGLLYQKHYDLLPRTADFQVLSIGQFLILATPAEVSTVAGQRIIEHVQQTVKRKTGQNVVAVLSPLANSYSGYVVTHEEYSAQRYEGGSTMYGPFTWVAH